MKKLILGFFILFVSLAITAQETGDSVLRSKKGIPILPQQGDWAIGVDAAPFLNYLGNALNGNTGNYFSLDYMTLYGRYFLSDNAAINIILAVDNSNILEKAYVRDDAAFAVDPLTRAKVVDTRKSVDVNKSIGIAYQKFRGYGRLKGYCGFMANYSYSRSRTVYAYGNGMTIANSNPTSNWDGSGDNTRTLEVDEGIYQGLTAGLISGVEYFFAPKISAGFNITLSASNYWKSQGNSKYEHLNGPVVEEIEIADSPKGRNSTYLYTGVGYGFDAGIYLMFHF